MANCQCMEKEGWMIDYHAIEHACFGLLAKGSLLQLFKPAYTHIFGFWKKKVTSSRIDRLQAKERLPMWCAGVKPCSLFLRCIAGCRRGKGEKLMKQGSHPSSIILLLVFPNLSLRADHQTRPRFTSSSNHCACFLCCQHETNELDHQIIVVISKLERIFFIKKKCRRRLATYLIRLLQCLVHHGISMLQILIREPVWYISISL